MRKLITLTAALVAALAMSSTTAARVDRIEFVGAEWMTGPPIDEGIEWVSDGDQLHIRGLTLVYAADSNSEYYRGTSTVVVNMNRDLETGLGTMWGTVELALDEFDGGFTGTWTATFAGWDEPTWTGRGRSHGYGEVDGFQQRFTLTQTSYGDTVEGFTFSPGNK